MAIVGSHALADEQAVKASMIVHGLMVVRKDIVEVVSGGADGVDMIAALVAAGRLKEVRVFPPANYRWEPYGFKDRNIQIAEYCDELVMIRAEDSPTFGSRWTANYAEHKLHKKVWRFYI